MIRFSTVPNSNNYQALSTRVEAQSQAQTTLVSNARVLLGSYELSNNVAAMKSQVAANNIKFNSNFTNSIQYLNAQAAVGVHKQVDGKIFVAADLFKSEKANNEKKSDLQSFLNNIDNTKRDKNGSNAMMYFQSKQNKKENENNKESKLNLLYA